MKEKAQEAAAAEVRVDVKSQVAKTLIEAMERGETPWQKPWASVSMRPVNPTTDNSYRGINRILLALSGRQDNRWLTYQQAQAKGWQVRKGEKGAMIVKLVELAAGAAGPEAAEQGSGASGEGNALGKKAFVLRRYTVFNAQQIEGVPALEAQAENVFDPVTRAFPWREAWLTATRARNALVLVRGRPTDQLPGPGRQLNAVAVAAGWKSGDGGEFLDSYLRVTRRAKAVVNNVFGS